MEQFIPYLQIVGGLILLTAGGEFIVRGAVGIALLLGVSKVIVGLTIVAAGTSAPEFVVSLNAALQHSGDIAVGNVVGSNIANILLILGAVALLRPVRASRQMIVRDGGTMLLGTLVFIGFAMLGTVERWAGAIMVLILAIIWYLTYQHDKKTPDEVSEIHEKEVDEVGETPKGWGKPLLATVIGIVGLTLGADWLVSGGVSVARQFGVSEAVIGLTLVAFGTSLPELSASIIAAFRGHSDVAIGNVVGSNLLNLLAIIGGVSVIAPIDIPSQIAHSDIWIMLAVTLLFLLVAFAFKNLGRFVGILFLALYGAYVTYLINI